jgi:hypothetical protein
LVASVCMFVPSLSWQNGRLISIKIDVRKTAASMVRPKRTLC